MSAVIDTLITRNGVICSEPEKTQRPRFEVSVAETQSEVLESQRLRYEIFAGELGAEIDGDIDCDEYDPWCRHLLVRETATGRLVACTRMLADTDAPNAGGFYSSGEFDLAMLDALPGRVMEIGRTCVHGDYRNGAVIATLWQGIASHVTAYGFDYLFGCASISLEDGGAQAHAVLQQVRARHLAPSYQRVRPYYPLPAVDARPEKWSADQNSGSGRVRMPPLLKAYMSLGAKACGEAYWDQQFNCADVFMLLNVSELNPRYTRHFMQRSTASSKAVSIQA